MKQIKQKEGQHCFVTRDVKLHKSLRFGSVGGLSAVSTVNLPQHSSAVMSLRIMWVPRHHETRLINNLEPLSNICAQTASSTHHRCVLSPSLRLATLSQVISSLHQSSNTRCKYENTESVCKWLWYVLVTTAQHFSLLLFSCPKLSNYIVTCRSRMCHDWKMLSACEQVCVQQHARFPDGGTEVLGWTGGRRYTPLEHDYIICHDVKRDTLSCLRKQRQRLNGKRWYY